jgi:hypothetical protein
MVYAYLTPDFRKHWLQSGELRIAEILQTDGRTDGWMNIKCLSNGRKNLITLKDQTKIMYQSSREICLRKSTTQWIEVKLKLQI